MNEHRRKHSTKHLYWLRWFIVVALFVCLILVVAKEYRDYQLVKGITEARTVKVQTVTTTDAIKAGDDNTPKPTYWDEDNRGLTVGKLAVPAVNISLPIIKGIGKTDGQDNMLKAAVTNKQDQEMGVGNYVLSSHEIPQENLLFSPLAKTKIGDEILITDLKKIYSYQTISKKTVKATQVDILDDVRNQRLITLYTCDPDGEIVNGKTFDRTVVVGKLVKTSKATKENLTQFGY